ncbi:MAG: DUF4394 domain-containing protein [Bacteroidota bacterium]
MKTFKQLTAVRWIAILAFAITLSACKKDKKQDTLVIGPDVNFFVLSENNKLSVANAYSGSNSSQLTVTGLQASETLLAIDFRPATGQLYGLGSTSRIYIINANTGVATALGTAPFTPALSGTAIGFDFNPTVDRIRIVTSTGQNLRVHPETGAVAFTDGVINAANGVTSVAYTDSRAGAAATILFDIDTKNNKLYKQDPPNDGVLVEVGNLNVDPEDVGGFDISSDGSAALASMTVGGKTGLYTINLTSGAATKVGDFQGQIIGLAIPTPAVAYAISQTNELIIYNPNTGTTINKAITGLQSGESVLGIDMRPANGQLYILGSSSRLYTVNASSGAAAAVGTAPFATLLVGTSFGFDFNPTVDRIRIVSNTGQNLRVHPETGAVAFVDGVLKPGTPTVTAAAYTNNFPGATATTLFDIDTQTNMLYKQDPPNEGTLTLVGNIGVDITEANGFDIGGGSGLAYALLTTGTTTRLYSINLTTGLATAVKEFPTGVKGFTIGLGF